MIKFLLYFFYVFVFILSGYVFFLGYGFIKNIPALDDQEKVPNSIDKGEEVIMPPQIIVHAVPFIPQAPFGNWGELRNQEGCEEASIIMAHAWAMGIEISPEKFNGQIKDISEYETKTFGTFIHTSLQDSAEILKGYFSFSDFEMREDASISRIVDALRAGSIVIVPASGRDLHNLFFTPPGPINHMLVIIGYDPDKKEFITNDPGTKNGGSYRYDEQVLYDAIWDYPTSDIDIVVPEKKEKTMLVIRKKDIE